MSKAPSYIIIDCLRADFGRGNYRKAFIACRKHRIDLNVIVDHDRETFMRRLPSFVEQVDDVDHINLFLTNLGRVIPNRLPFLASNFVIRRGTQHPRVIADLCDAIRLELERKDMTRFVNSILTAYVVKTPPDHEAGLELLLRLRGQNYFITC
jgi:elongator complex protein 1